MTILYSWGLSGLAGVPVDDVTDTSAAAVIGATIGRDLQIELGTRELVTENGDLVITKGSTALKQAIDMHLKFFLGEWFLDQTVGVPYFQNILVKSPSLAQIENIFRSALLDVPGVAKINDLKLAFVGQTRKLNVTWRVSSDFGEFISGVTTGTTL